MPPKVKYQKEEIIQAAFAIARQNGIEAVTSRAIAQELGVSTRPIFTYYETIIQLKRDVFEAARNMYRDYVMRGLSEPIPFLGVGQQYIRFAKEEPELYKLLFLTKPDGTCGGAMETLAFSQDLVRESLMRIYNMDAAMADCYFRNLWLMAFSFATLIVTDDCPYSEEQISSIFTEVSLSILKAYKEIPGLSIGDYDRDGLLRELVQKA